MLVYCLHGIGVFVYLMYTQEDFICTELNSSFSIWNYIAKKYKINVKSIGTLEYVTGTFRKRIGDSVAYTVLKSIFLVFTLRAISVHQYFINNCIFGTFKYKYGT